jgi:hypothetical protein
VRSGAICSNYLILQRYPLFRTWHGRLARVAWYSTQFDPYSDRNQHERSDFFDMIRPNAAILLMSVEYDRPACVHASRARRSVPRKGGTNRLG